MTLLTKKLVILLIFLMFTAGCQKAEPPKPVEKETPTPDAGTFPVLHVPAGDRPVIDGILSPNEWENAAITAMSDGSELFWMYAEDMLYVAARTPGLGSMNLAIQYGDQIHILHSSAALGSAIYEKGKDHWNLTQDYSWCCRSTIVFDEMDQLFQAEGWLASIGYLGTPGEVEFQVTVPAGEIRVAVCYVLSETQFSYWPEELNQASVEQLKGEPADVEDFQLDQWVLLEMPG